MQGTGGSNGLPQFQETGTEGSTPQASLGQGNPIPPRPVNEAGQGQQVHVHAALPDGQFTPQLQQAFAQFQAVNQQLAAQLAHTPVNPGNPVGGPNYAQNHVPANAFQQPPFMQPPYQQIVVHHQQHHQQPGVLSQQPATGFIPQQLYQINQQGIPAAHATTQGIARTQAPGTTHSVPAVSVGSSEGLQQQGGPSNPSSQVNVQVPNSDMNLPRHESQASQDHHSSTQSPGAVAFTHLQSYLSGIEAAMAEGNPVPEAVIDQARDMLRKIPDLAPDGRSNINTRLDGLAAQANRLRETLDNHLNRAAQERIAMQRGNQRAPASAVYVVSSPIGPQALLVSPNGIYSSPWQSSHPGPTSYPFILQQSHHIPSQVQPSVIRNPAGGHQAHNQVVQAQTPQPRRGNAVQVQPAQQAQQQQQQQQQQQVNQARDLLRILLPLGGHLWLLVRLSGFVYFFTAGAGWRRTMLFGILACLVFIAQTGVFRPIVQSIWGPLRRHAEGLVPLAGNERAAAGATGINGNPNIAGVQANNHELTPQQAAERLLQERERQDVDFMRQTLRRIERAVALFVASLVPGVGERHIAVREAAEAARQAEIRERQDRLRRDEEENRQRQTETPSEAADTGGNSNDLASTVPSQEQATSPPVVEV